MAERKIKELVCDRCEEVGRELPGAINYFKDWGTMTVISSDRDAPIPLLSKTTDGMADLCPKCLNELIEWQRTKPHKIVGAK